MTAAQRKRLEKLEKLESATKDDAAFLEAVRESEEFFTRAAKEYNSPENRARREAEYQELCRIGKLREQAFKNGEPMDKYPLPWKPLKDVSFEDYFKKGR